MSEATQTPVDEIETCEECGADLSLDEGEGYDGLCGDCADRADAAGRWGEPSDVLLTEREPQEVET